MEDGLLGRDLALRLLLLLRDRVGVQRVVLLGEVVEALADLHPHLLALLDPVVDHDGDAEDDLVDVGLDDRRVDVDRTRRVEALPLRVGERRVLRAARRARRRRRRRPRAGGHRGAGRRVDVHCPVRRRRRAGRRRRRLDLHRLPRQLARRRDQPLALAHQPNVRRDQLLVRQPHELRDLRNSGARQRRLVLREVERAEPLGDGGRRGRVGAADGRHRRGGSQHRRDAEDGKLSALSRR